VNPSGAQPCAVSPGPAVGRPTPGVSERHTVGPVSTDDLDPHSGSFYRPLGHGRYQPTLHVQGAWQPHEQHMAPVSGLLMHAVDQHEPRDGMQAARISFEILGMIPAEVSEISVRTVRPGRTIELVEATLAVDGRTVVRASVWRLSRQDTSAVAGGAPPRMPEPEAMTQWTGSDVWPGGYIAALEFCNGRDNVPGRGQVWIRTDTTLVEGVTSSPTAAFVGLVDTANGVATRVGPREWMYPNVDLSIHLYRQPVSGPVGLDTTVVFGADGVGLTSSTLHDVHGPVGRSEQILTVRPLPAQGG